MYKSNVNGSEISLSLIKKKNARITNYKQGILIHQEMHGIFFRILKMVVLELRSRGSLNNLS